jgi:hypothetical protein
MHQCYLMQRVRQRPVWQPIRDPIRHWTDPTTWRWHRQIPMDGWTEAFTPNTCCPRLHSHLEM